ncbi:hypothetical protein KKE78_03385 [Patescibacteria group bacterium]|nr:hypothetical protein [Patescibacteria group bacterium]
MELRVTLLGQVQQPTTVSFLQRIKDWLFGRDLRAVFLEEQCPDKVERPLGNPQIIVSRS